MKANDNSKGIFFVHFLYLYTHTHMYTYLPTFVWQPKPKIRIDMWLMTHFRRGLLTLCPLALESFRLTMFEMWALTCEFEFILLLNFYYYGNDPWKTESFNYLGLVLSTSDNLCREITSNISETKWTITAGTFSLWSSYRPTCRSLCCPLYFRMPNEHQRQWNGVKHKVDTCQEKPFRSGEPELDELGSKTIIRKSVQRARYERFCVSIV